MLSAFDSDRNRRTTRWQRSIFHGLLVGLWHHPGCVQTAQYQRKVALGKLGSRIDDSAFSQRFDPCREAIARRFQFWIKGVVESSHICDPCLSGPSARP